MSSGLLLLRLAVGGIMALVTSIGVDHADYLGDTRESVAYEKAGIFRQGAPALCGDLNPPQVLRSRRR